MLMLGAFIEMQYIKVNITTICVLNMFLLSLDHVNIMYPQ